MMNRKDKIQWLAEHGRETNGGYNPTGGIYHIVWIPKHINMEFTGYGLTPDSMTDDLYDTIRKRLFNLCNVISYRKGSDAYTDTKSI